MGREDWNDFRADSTMSGDVGSFEIGVHGGDSKNEKETWSSWRTGAQKAWERIEDGTMK